MPTEPTQEREDEFDRFRVLTKNLIVVPKSEVDEQEREWRDQNVTRRRPKPIG
jgi:hypothetical protein